MADTKTRLQSLVSSIPAADDKSLLLQTVALFEALLAKIRNLQEENEKLQRVKDDGKSHETLVLELEQLRKLLEESQQVIT